MTIKRFIKVEYDLLRSDGFVCKGSGEVVKLITLDKLAYSYLKARMHYFITERKGEYYDTQEAIATALAVDIKSAAKSLKKLSDFGVLHRHSFQHRSHVNYKYTGLEDLNLFVYEKTDVKGEDGKYLRKIVMIADESDAEGESKPEGPPIDDDFWMHYDPDTEIDNWSVL